VATHIVFGGRLVMLGFGSIGQGVLPLISRHIEIPREHIHIAERDTQSADIAKQRDDTWSIDGFVGDGNQSAEPGWGTHDRTLPPDGRHHDFGCGTAIYLNRRGAPTRMRSWTPLEGAYQGFLITHNESISIADYYTLTDGETVRYRLTVHYAYHPCDAAVLSLHELAGRNWRMQVQATAVDARDHERHG